MSGDAGSFYARGARRLRRSMRGVQRSRLLVSLTPTERAFVEEGARLRGVSLSRFLVEAALHPLGGEGGGVVDEEAVELLRAYRRQLEGAMTNLNQIAHYANTVRAIPADFDEVVRGVASVVEDVHSLLDRVRRSGS